MNYNAIVENHEELKNVVRSSHAFWLANDIADDARDNVYKNKNKTFFPSKHIPLLIQIETRDEYINRVLPTMLDVWGKVEVTAFGISAKTQHILDENLDIFPCILLFNAQKLTERKRFDFSDLVEIMFVLRGENGCSWDRAQTHESIRINLIEEAYELVEAIDKNDNSMMLEETGDVLLQAIFHTHIEADEKHFDYVDMLSALCEKLISRHTHIFGENHADNAEQALNFWNDAKKKEKGYTSYTNAMDLVPKNMPSLLYAYKIQKKASKAGFDWDDVQGAIDKVNEELCEVMEAKGEVEKTMEGGDLLFAVVNVLRMLKIEPELALKAASEKFLKRFSLVEKEITKQGKEITECTIDELNEVWDRIKLTEKNEKA